MLDIIWSEARRRLREELSEKDYRAWIEPLRAVRWSSGSLTVEAPNGLCRSWLRRYFQEPLERAVSEASGAPASFSVVVNPALDVPAERLAPRAAEPASPSPIQDRCTFDNFVVGVSNRVAYTGARAVVQQPGARFNPLFLCGDFGLGKTHLLSAVARGFAQEWKPSAVRFVAAETFVNEMVESLKRREMHTFRNRYRGIGMLVIDDIQFLGGKRRSQEEFRHTFNALYEGRKQIVLASDKPPHELPNMEHTLRERLAAGLLAQIEAPDPALRMALVGRKAAALGLVLDPEVTAYLAEEWCANCRKLEGALMRVEAWAGITARPITLALVREALGPTRGAQMRQPTFGRIIEEVCQEFNLTRDQLTSVRRTARIALPRQLAMYLARHHIDVSLARIGQELGNRDHSTVVHGLKAVERRLNEDARLRRKVLELRARLRA